MDRVVRLGRGDEIVTVPVERWREELAGARSSIGRRLEFMTPDHHRVRYFVVDELPRNAGRPLEVARIAEALKLPRERVVTLLDDLERNLFFLVRDETGAVSWAFPVTAQVTPHRLAFRSGERLYAA